MSNIWFTSDLHLGHKKIIEYCNRPFKSIEEMDEALIENWNARVENIDRIYVLGDFSFHNPERTRVIFNRLQGNKHLIIGNHDKPKVYADLPWGWIKDVYMLSAGNDVTIWLSHYAYRRWPQSHKGTYHLYGHSHGDFEGYFRSCDAGVDAWNYAPVSIERIVNKLHDSDKTDHHKQR
jgi:calcineurin-like phosphoesterase family protein